MLFAKNLVGTLQQKVMFYNYSKSKYLQATPNKVVFLYLKFSKMAAIDNLTPEQTKSLEEAKKLITIEILNSFEYGEEKKLNEDFSVYHYTEEEMVVIVLTEEWEEVLQVLYWNEEIIFEAL